MTARIGVHLGLGAGHERALAHAQRLGCGTVQIFTHSPQSFRFVPIDERRAASLREGWERLGIRPVVSHCCYLINLGSPDNRAFYGSVSTARKELEYAKAFGCSYFVLHVGKHLGAGKEAGLRQVARGLGKLKETIVETGVTVLLETVAGQGTEIGATFDELHKIIMMVDEEVRPRIGVAVDTCHIFAAGYDIGTPEGADAVVCEMERTFGIDRVKVIHVNDSKFGVGERKDRHEHLGKGRIGIDGLRAFLKHPKMRRVPMILETPVDEDGDQETDLRALRAMLR